ncbi:MAG: hypothetical protein CMP44_00310 [Rickettsiales bacterium]|mgnify:FL=1|nr:hypothetical protein [Rickettsiales bacterium]|tara:strand:+ start:7890 stop:8327 length:438 start_codon:yes stop_codon:yes gene_type:complete
MENKSIKDEIKKTYEKFNTIFLKETGRHLQEFKISEIRDQFKAWIKINPQMFNDLYDAEDSFLYIYHFRELQEINRVGIMLREMTDQVAYRKFIQEFFDDNSPSGLQDLKVHQLNNESDKVWHSRDSKVDSLIAEWREQRFSPYL